MWKSFVIWKENVCLYNLNFFFPCTSCYSISQSAAMQFLSFPLPFINQLKMQTHVPLTRERIFLFRWTSDFRLPFLGHGANKFPNKSAPGEISIPNLRLFPFVLGNGSSTR